MQDKLVKLIGAESVLGVSDLEYVVEVDMLIAV